MLWILLSVLTVGVVLLVLLLGLFLWAIITAPEPEELLAEIEARAAERRLHVIARTSLEQMLAAARDAGHGRSG